MSEILFTPYKINGLELKNRIIMTAMHLGYADRHQVTQKDLDFYRERAIGEAAAMTVVAAVNEIAGPLNMHNLGDDSFIEGFKKLSEVVHEHNSKLFVQLFHCGRNGNQGFLNGKKPLAPSAIPSPLYKETPGVMTISDIQNTIRNFGEAALRCKKAGVDGVEISCSAGYLLSQFLSPITNQRTDIYGGSEENRMHFPKEVIKSIREYVGPDYPIILRISGSDMLGGYGIRDMQTFCSSIDAGLIDAINVTGGWHESPVPQISAHLPEGGFTFLAESIKRVVDVPVIGCNRINNRQIAEDALQKGLCNFVGAARAFLTDAHFVRKIKNQEPYRKCIACNKGCIDRIFIEKDVRCVLNPSTGKESHGLKPTETAKRVLVIGSGPAGIEAAKNAALKGHKVTIASKDKQFGGLLLAASKTPFKKDLSLFIDTLTYELNKLDVTVYFNTEVNEQYIKDMQPDYIIIATGSRPIIPPIKGIDQPYVHLAEDVLNADQYLLSQLRKGKNFIIGGGAVGLETALFIAEQSYLSSHTLDFMNQYVVSKDVKKQLFNPAEITVVEMTNKIGNDLGGTRWITRSILKQYGVNIFKNTKVLSVANNKIVMQTEDNETSAPVDNVILAAGYQRCSNEIVSYIEKNFIPYIIVGDALKPRNIMYALQEAYDATINL